MPVAITKHNVTSEGLSADINQGESKSISTDVTDIIDTIVAPATAIGFAGISIIRLSGLKSSIFTIIEKILRTSLKPRYAYYGDFHYLIDKQSDDNKIIDKGIAIYFAAPNSYTGEDVLELHCHGGPIVTDIIISEILKLNSELNIRLAEPGEFTKRAWVNGKMDLAQVESVTDLINATSVQAAQSAISTLNGQFSNMINGFLEQLIYLRTYIEAAIDFSDQEIDFIKDGAVINKLNLLKEQLVDIISQTKQGVLLQEGVDIVIAGQPNVGKSSLLNALCRSEEAIVTEIPGTTRDVIKTNLNIKGVPVSLVDTAGLRDTMDLVEKQGIKKALENIEKADFTLLVLDVNNISLEKVNKLIGLNDTLFFSGSEFEKLFSDVVDLNISSGIDSKKLLSKICKKVILVINKIDTLNYQDTFDSQGVLNAIEIKAEINNSQYEFPAVLVSAKENRGIENLESIILSKIGYKQTNEGKFIARRRHLESLKKVEQALQYCEDLFVNQGSHDLIAEELRNAQVYLGEITGEYSPDDLLGNIFSSFCIGK